MQNSKTTIGRSHIAAISVYLDASTLQVPQTQTFVSSGFL
jgi:hypothetical protein